MSEQIYSATERNKAAVFLTEQLSKADIQLYNIAINLQCELNRAVDLLRCGNLDRGLDQFARIVKEVNADHPRTPGWSLYYLTQTSEHEHLANWNDRRRDFLSHYPEGE